MSDKVFGWDALTQDQRDHLCNGCGGKGGLFDPPDYCFEASCDRHDFGYWWGGTEDDRRRVDWGFLSAMLRDARRAGRWYSRWWLLGAAWRYYWAVRAFGGKYWHRGVRADPWADLEKEMTDG